MDDPEVRVTFELSMFTFQLALDEELEAEGFAVQLGPAPEIERGGREVIEVARYTIEVLGDVSVVAGSVALGVKAKRAIQAAIAKSKVMPETIGTILGPNGEVLDEVHAPGKRDER